MNKKKKIDFELNIYLLVKERKCWCVSRISRKGIACPDRCKHRTKCQLYMYALSLTLFHWLEASMFITRTDYPETTDFELQYVSPFHWMYIHIKEIARVGRTSSTEFRCFLKRIKSGDIIPIHYKPQKFCNDDQPVYLVMAAAIVVEYIFFPHSTCIRSRVRHGWGSWKWYIPLQFSTAYN